MRRIYISAAIAILLASCGNQAGNNNLTSGADTVGLTNPVSIDTMKHPSGVDNSSVISTDTAAMNTGNAIKKADSISKNRK